MNFYSLRKKRIAAAVFGAAVSLVLTVQNTALPYIQANALTVAEDTDEEEQDNNVSAEVLDDVFGEVVLYRWERMKNNNYPKDNDPHPVLIFWGATRSKVMNPVAPSDIYLDSAHAVIEGANWFGRDGNGDYPLSKYDYGNPNKNTNPYGAAALKLHDTANYTELKDSAAVRYSNVFYTKSDYNCMYAQYTGIEKETKCPYFTLRLSNGSGSVPSSMSDYVINLPTAGETGMQETGQLKITRGNERAPGYEDIVFKYESDHGLFHIMDANESDNDVYMVSQDGYAIAEVKYEHFGGMASSQFTAEAETADIYFGETYRYSAIRESVDIEKGQIVSVTPSQYADAEGNSQKQNGVIIPNGTTITVHEGGVLAVSGDLINNGTIINDGGTILIKDGGNIYPFRTGVDVEKNGCGTIKCLGGDIIIRPGGALYAGLNDEGGSIVPFHLDEGSTLINQGLLVYGAMKLGQNARVELHENSHTYGSWFMANYKHDSAYVGTISEEQEKQSRKKAADLGYCRFDYDRASGVVNLYSFEPTAQDDMLSKFNSYFLEDSFSGMSGQIKETESNDFINEQGLYLDSHVDDKTMPRVFCSSAAAKFKDPCYNGETPKLGELVI